MNNFWQWLKHLTESWHERVPPSVLQSYEFAFRDHIRELAQQTRDPAVRKQFEQMLDCPITDSKGNCRGFAEYAVAAMLRHGIQTRFDLEASLAYIVEKMLLPRGEQGKPRKTLFADFDPNTPDSPQHLQARFLSWLKFAVNNIHKGKIPRLSSVEQRPQGTVSIGQGRTNDDDQRGVVSPDEIPARSSANEELEGMIEDITALLRKKERASHLPLVALFHSTLAGQTIAQQRAKFGDGKAREGRKVVIQTIEDHARSTGNDSLLGMLQQRKEFRVGQQTTKPKPEKKPVPSEQERDYGSILAVLERFGDRPIGSAEFGKYRRRWLDFAPRDPSGGHRNRLEEVLARMVKDGVLRTTRTAKGALLYSPGENAAKYGATAGV